MTAFYGLQIQLGGIAAALDRCTAACARLNDAVVAGDSIKIREAADAIREDASRVQALSATVSRHIVAHRTRRVRSV